MALDHWVVYNNPPPFHKENIKETKMINQPLIFSTSFTETLVELLNNEQWFALTGSRYYETNEPSSDWDFVYIGGAGSSVQMKAFPGFRKLDEYNHKSFFELHDKGITVLSKTFKSGEKIDIFLFNTAADIQNKIELDKRLKKYYSVTPYPTASEERIRVMNVISTLTTQGI